MLLSLNSVRIPLLVFNMAYSARVESFTHECHGFRMVIVIRNMLQNILLLGTNSTKLLTHLIYSSKLRRLEICIISLKF